jgi:hypothetical protein
MGRLWLKQYGIDSPEDVVRRLADIYAKLTGEIGGVFRLTADEPDRDNNHQSHAASHPLWLRIVAIGTEKIGEPEAALVRLDRTKLDESKAFRQIVGYVTSIADRRQKYCGSKRDVVEIVADGLIANGIMDHEIEAGFVKKAKASGTMQALLAFPTKEAA